MKTLHRTVSFDQLSEQQEALQDDILMQSNLRFRQRLSKQTKHS